MGLNGSFEANSQLAEGSQPSMRALDYPSVTPEPIVALDASSSDAVLDAAALEVVSAACKVVAFVSVQLVRPAARPAAPAAYTRQRIDQFFEDHRVMSVGPGDAEDQRNALAVRDDVALAAEFASIRGVRARVRAPRGLGTLAPSRLARLKSSWPALRSSASNNKCKRCHTPAACQSRSLRQQVMPLPKPNSCGRSSQAMPVRSTKTMPLRASSSFSRGRPPRGDGFTTGSSGCTRSHSAALTSCFLFMLRQRTSFLFR